MRRYGAVVGWVLLIPGVMIVNVMAHSGCSGERASFRSETGIQQYEPRPDLIGRLSPVNDAERTRLIEALDVLGLEDASDDELGSAERGSFKLLRRRDGAPFARENCRELEHLRTVAQVWYDPVLMVGPRGLVSTFVNGIRVCFDSRRTEQEMLAVLNRSGATRFSRDPHGRVWYTVEFDPGMGEGIVDKAEWFVKQADVTFVYVMVSIPSEVLVK